MDFLTVVFGLGIWATAWFLIYLYIVTAKFLGAYVDKIPVISIKNFIYISFGFFTWFLISTLYWGYPFGIIINLIMIYLFIWMGIGSLILNSLLNLSDKSKSSQQVFGKIFYLISKIPILGNGVVLLIIIILIYANLGIELMEVLIKYLKFVLN